MAVTRSAGEKGSIKTNNVIDRRFYLGLMVLVLLGARPSPGAMYNVVDLGTLGGLTSQANAINNAGQIVGSAYTNGSVSHAALWTNPSSPAIDLGTLPGGTTSSAFGINDSNQIIGDSTASSALFATCWTNGANPAVDLGTLGGTFSVGSAINAAGQMVGLAYTTNNFYSYASFWTNTSSSAIQLIGLTNGLSSAANVINTSGQIGGWSYNSNGIQHAVFWSNSGALAIDLWHGQNFSSDALGLNDSGNIVGWGYTSSSVQHAYFWNNTNNPAVDLGTLGGIESGQIVGWSDVGGGASHAALWMNSSSAAIDLNTLIPTNSGWTLESATAINDSGEIVGYGIINGHTHAFAMVLSAPGDLFIALVGANVQLTFSTSTNEFYDVQRADDLVTNDWSTIASNITGTGSTITNIDVGGATVPQRFYRVGAHF
jgi:probable HAF family extracellular repeat protein